MAKGREQWRSVRHRRAEPPALAGQADDRRQVFQSGLAQAEELWDAAAVAGPASRPLPLFYCISQAGRAVCAAATSIASSRSARSRMSKPALSSLVSSN